MQNINPSEIDIILTEDKGGLNLGSFFVRNTPAMRLLIDILQDPILVNYGDEHFRLREQDLLLHLTLEHPALRERVGFVPQRLINAYQDHDTEDVRWHKGDLLAHFPNCVYASLSFSS